MSEPHVVGIVGTGMAFDRLVEALATWKRRHPDAHVWIQHGPGKLPSCVDGAPLVPRDDLLERVRGADVVVCHAGSGTIADVIELGHTPVVLARRGHLGEHVNDHQAELVTGPLAGRILAVDEGVALDDAIEAARRRRTAAGAGGRGGTLVETVRDAVGAVRPPARRAELAWRVLGPLTRWVSVSRPHRP